MAAPGQNASAVDGPTAIAAARMVSAKLRSTRPQPNGASPPTPHPQSNRLPWARFQLIAPPKPTKSAAAKDPTTTVHMPAASIKPKPSSTKGKTAASGATSGLGTMPYLSTALEKASVRLTFVSPATRKTAARNHRSASTTYCTHTPNLLVEQFKNRVGGSSASDQGQ